MITEVNFINREGVKYIFNTSRLDTNYLDYRFKMMEQEQIKEILGHISKRLIKVVYG